MQTPIRVHCTTGPSLRAKIAKDQRLADHSLYAVKEQQAGRSPGWLKIKSTEPNRHGAINLQWDAEGTLRCRVVNRGRGKPDSIVGDFLEYLLARHSKRIIVVAVLPQ
jgi:hypothetical protein